MRRANLRARSLGAVERSAGSPPSNHRPAGYHPSERRPGLQPTLQALRPPPLQPVQAERRRRHLLRVGARVRARAITPTLALTLALALALALDLALALALTLAVALTLTLAPSLSKAAAPAPTAGAASWFPPSPRVAGSPPSAVRCAAERREKCHAAWEM